MPAWAGKWKGGRYYLDEFGRRVFFIERRGRSVRLATHDEDLAVGELARYLADPVAFVRPAPAPLDVDPVAITAERATLYLESIRDTVKDHRKARASYLAAWSRLGLDLRVVDKRALRLALATFKGGHRGRVEALNAFANFLVREGDLPSWSTFENPTKPKATRAPRMAYSLDELRDTFRRLSAGPVRDLYHLRVATGMHHTEIAQLEGCRVQTGPLSDQGAAIRTLPEGHEIRGVIQVKHKNGKRHRVSVGADVLEAAKRLRDGVPDRITAWEAFRPIVPSNLRHTFATLAAECGEVVPYKTAGVDRSRVAQAMGHRAGSTMLPDRYDRQQVPAMIRIPLGF